jgi:TonB-dependent starch-binding outer membrane protein SusC
MKNWFSFLITFHLIFIGSIAHGQVSITGVVTDYSTQETLPGVSIALKGTTHGTITDVDGNYLIRAQVGDTLVFTYIGYIPEEFIIGGPSIINVSMTMDIIGLEEIVVIGYGTQRKESVVGAIVQTSGADMERTGGQTSLSIP